MVLKSVDWKCRFISAFIVKTGLVTINTLMKFLHGLSKICVFKNYMIAIFLNIFTKFALSYINTILSFTIKSGRNFQFLVVDNEFLPSTTHVCLHVKHREALHFCAQFDLSSAGVLQMALFLNTRFPIDRPFLDATTTFVGPSSAWMSVSMSLRTTFSWGISKKWCTSGNTILVVEGGFLRLSRCVHHLLHDFMF